jgi:hypothetical protein
LRHIEAAVPEEFAQLLLVGDRLLLEQLKDRLLA